MDEIKQIFKNVFPRDLRSVDPTKKGLILGESLRVYEEKTGPVLSFLKGTDNRTRKQYTERLDQHSVAYKIGKDFEL